MNNQSHNLLILGSMDEFVELVELARNRGYRTIVVDGYADGPAKRYADAKYDIPITDAKALAEVCKRERVDGIITAYSDILFQCLCRLSDLTGIPSYCPSAGMNFLRDKTLMKKMFEDLSIPTPQSFVVSSKDESFPVVNYPCVIKPVAGYGSRGVFVVEDEAQARARAVEAECVSSQGKAIMEEYNPDYEFNMIAWVADGAVHAVSIADREKSSEVSWEVSHVSRIVYPSRLQDSVREEALAIVQRVSAYVGLRNGPICMQFFWSAKRGLQVCEIAGRVFGYEHELLFYSSGLRVEDLLLDTVYDKKSLRRRLEDHDIDSFSRCCCGLYFHGREAVIGSMDGAVAAIGNAGDSVCESFMYYREGERVGHGFGEKPYVARIYLCAENYDSLDHLTFDLYRSFDVCDENGKSIVYHNELPSYE